MQECRQPVSSQQEMRRDDSQANFPSTRKHSLVYNNNNGGLHACVRVSCSSPSSSSVHTNASGFLALAIFIFLFLCSDSPSTVCLFTEDNLTRMLRLFYFVLGEFQAPPIGWRMNYSVLRRFQWIRLDANILETMPSKS